MKPLRILVDGPNMAHRFRHTHTLRNSKGRPTGVLYGFLNAMTNLMDDFAPSEIVVCWDADHMQALSWRYLVYPGYKSARADRSNALSEADRVLLSEFHDIQIKDVKNMLCALGIPQQQVSGAEADDLIAANVMRTHTEKIRCMIVSTDKDMLQLVKAHECTVFNPMTKEMYYQDDLGRLRMASQAEPIATTPKIFLWRRVLSGDTSDSIPGIPGIGDKRAIALTDDGSTTRPTSTQDITEWLINNFSTDGFVDKNDPIYKYGRRALDNLDLISRNVVLMELTLWHLAQYAYRNTMQSVDQISRSQVDWRQVPRHTVKSEHFGVFVKKGATKYGSPLYKFFYRREFEFIMYRDRALDVVSTFRLLYKRRKELYLSFLDAVD